MWLECKECVRELKKAGNREDSVVFSGPSGFWTFSRKIRSHLWQNNTNGPQRFILSLFLSNMVVAGHGAIQEEAAFPVSLAARYCWVIAKTNAKWYMPLPSLSIKMGRPLPPMLFLFSWIGKLVTMTKIQ